jgi:hypothetical protein
MQYLSRFLATILEVWKIHCQFPVGLWVNVRVLESYQIVCAPTGRFAITALAPSCNHCGCRIIGHGVEVNGTSYCCAHCASKEGARGVRDRS